MTIERKVGMGIAGQPSGGATNVADVFSAHLYNGTYGTPLTVTNGIDLAGEGGLVWLKMRNDANNHNLFDTERGVTKELNSNAEHAQNTVSGLTSFNSNGFTVGSEYGNNGGTMASWTFRKKKKFFTCLTYSGNGVTGRQIAHDLDGPVGMILIKSTNTANDWQVWHTTTGSAGAMFLNTTAAVNNSGYWWNSTNPTSTHFTLGARNQSNNSSAQYVAYLFADNSAEDAEDQMIKCGSVNISSGTAGASTVTLGWEPQFVLIKRSTYTEDWIILDSMRGLASPPDGGSNSKALWANLSSNENNSSAGIGMEALHTITPTGFTIGNDLVNTGHTYIYMAIRAPMMVKPKAATDVFAVSTEATFGSDRLVSAGFAVDATISSQTGTSGASHMTNRLTAGTWLSPDESSAQGTGAYWLYDESEGVKGTNTQYGSVSTVWNMWKRAKGFFDVVAYSGTGANRTLPHSLSVVPEMMWVKSRTTAEQWVVYHSSMALSVGTSPPRRIISYLNLNNRPALNTAWDNQDPTDSVFSLGGTQTTVNQSNIPYIAYLFATLDGVSKCGGYTGNGSSQTISCGFSAGSRFVLIHRTDDPDDDGVSGNWYVWDSVRGIVAGNDPHLSLNSSAAQVTSNDSVDPHNSGFIVNQVSATNINVSSGKYIFYAIA